MLAHYASMNVDAKQKSFVFSDGLDVETSWDLFLQCKGRVKTFFGIGTNLTNDLGVKPLNVVLKMVECNGQPVAKVSDSNGKEMCKDVDYIKHLKNVFKIKS
jgi:nicotinate phosphoribosyltransferase